MINNDLKSYSSLIETIAKVEYSRLNTSHLIDFSEMVNIGHFAVHIVLTKHKKENINISYISTAIKWAIRNELRRRYRWYTLKNCSDDKFEDENLSQEEKEDLREAIYKTILSIDNAKEDEPTLQIRDTDYTPAEKIEFAELRNAIKLCIEQLPPRERMIVENRFYQNQKLKHIAEENNISLSRVSRIIQNALDKVKAELKQKHLL